MILNAFRERPDDVLDQMNNIISGARGKLHLHYYPQDLKFPIVGPDKLCTKLSFCFLSLGLSQTNFICFLRVMDWIHNLECRTKELDDECFQIVWTTNFFETYQNHFNLFSSVMWYFLQSISPFDWSIPKNTKIWKFISVANA